jgi:hypothetical protein
MALSGAVAHADEDAVVINGRRLSMFEAAALELRLGMDIPPGSYLVNTRTGCWTNQANGAKGCLDQRFVSDYLADKGSVGS